MIAPENRGEFPSRVRTTNTTPRRHVVDETEPMAAELSGDAMTVEYDSTFRSLREMAGEWIGEASMCWTDTPRGVFDSEHAMRLTDRLVAELCVRVAEELVWALGSNPEHSEPIRNRISQLMRGEY
jgi:hypothetical protein